MAEIFYPEVLADLASTPTIADLSTSFRLPNNNDIRPHRVPDQRLLDLQTAASNRYYRIGHGDADFMRDFRDRYDEVRHRIDQGPLQQQEHVPPDGQEDQVVLVPKDTYLALSRCHNTLRQVRREEYLDHDGIYRLAERLTAWLQDQPSARHLGPVDWWIAPAVYILQVVQKGDKRTTAYPQPPPRLGDPVLDDEGARAAHGDRSRDWDDFGRALFTIHFVHIDDNENAGNSSFLHYGLLIYQKSSGSTWYMDSQRDNRRARSMAARKAFNAWLRISGLPGVHGTRPPNHAHYTVAVPEQADGWTCGLHSIAHAAAFIRLGVMGWHHIDRWGAARNPCRAMHADLTRSLHALMRMKYVLPEEQVRPPSPRDRRSRAPTPSQGICA